MTLLAPLRALLENSAESAEIFVKNGARRFSSGSRRFSTITNGSRWSAGNADWYLHDSGGVEQIILVRTVANAVLLLVRHVAAAQVSRRDIDVDVDVDVY